MNVSIQKRYCFKQSHSWGGGFGSVLADQKRLQEKHPEADVVIEYNERSTSTRYRIVRLDRVEVEVPDMPEKEAYDVPDYPKPERLADHDIQGEVVIDPVQPATQGYNVYPKRAVITRKLVVTHIPSGTVVERRIWSETADTWILDAARFDLEQQIDPTYNERVAHYLVRNKIYENAMKAWRLECENAIKEAHTFT